jgi:hypothetical protein
LSRRILAVACLLFCLGGVTRAEPMPAAEPIDALIQRSGLEAQLVHFEAAMQRGITSAHQSQPGLPPEQLSRMRKAVAHAYAPSSLRPALRAALAKSLSRAEIASALAWLDSPTGRKLTALEEDAATPAAQQRLEAAARRGIPPLAAERAETLHGLVEATRADQAAASILIETAIGINEGFALFGPEGSDTTVATLRREMESERAELVAELHEQSFVAFALVYAEATDAELAALLRFSRSPAGARYHDVTSRAFASTLAQAARRLGGALAAPAAPADI